MRQVHVISESKRDYDKRLTEADKRADRNPTLLIITCIIFAIAGFGGYLLGSADSIAGGIVFLVVGIVSVLLLVAIMWKLRSLKRLRNPQI